MKAQLDQVRIFYAISTSFEIQKYYQNEPNLMVIIQEIIYLIMEKDGAYVLNLDEFQSIESHWIDLYVNRINATYVDGFGVEHVPKEIKNFIGHKNIITKS